MPRLAAVLAVVLLPAAGRADDADFFETKVRPVLAEHCYACHSASGKKAKGGLTLDTPDGIRKGGDSGPAVVAGDTASLLVKAVEYHPDAPAMPPKGKLPARAVQDLRAWVKAGAALPEARAAQAGPAARDLTTAKQFWSFRPLREHLLPPTSRPDWPTRRHDHFVLAKLDEQKLRPAPPADRRVLARRVSFDLVGLPPTVEQVEAFATDERPDAYERMVDDLLASPRFGEKWARHWLDVARYAEDHSTGEATCRPPRFPYRYRDWVIAALNADVPFDQFVRRQLAADLMPGLPPGDLAALGFLGLSPVYHKEPKLSADVIAGIVADEWDERVDVVTRGFLGLTVACARCHDHKFDPVSSDDYYALAGVMANTQLAERPLTVDPDAGTEELTTVRLKLVDVGGRLGYAKEHRATAVKEGRDPAPFERDAKRYEAELAALKEREKRLFAGPIAPAVRDAGTWVNADDPAWTTLTFRTDRMRDLPVFVRGNPMKTGPAPVPRRFLRVLSAGEPEPFRAGSGRRELAEAIVADARGLTARVFVNRVWGWVFGRPLVTTPSNFGALGDPPTHPELLDDLAARLVANGWSVKWLVRELVLSAAYRQSSRHDEVFARRDADNRWLWRAHRKRLEVEGWRDAMLQVSGRLDLAGGGPSDALDAPGAVRRTVYGKVSRQRAADVHRLFDLPDPKAHGEKRDPTVTPVQQLYFLNSPFVRTAAAGVARQAARAAATPRDNVRLLYRRVLLRDPTAAETEAGLDLAGEPAAWDVLAQVLLASNEFLFLN
ncbi:PSD1 domain-containing protein [bacterium]|nr:PSD1 domain-containing protein [bacterium]